MMSSTRPSLSHELADSPDASAVAAEESTKGSTAIEARRWAPRALEAVDGRRRRRLHAQPHPRAHRIGLHRPADVAQPERAQLLDRLGEAAADQVHDRGRDQHAADRGMLLQARHDVDAVAQQVGAFDRHLAHVDGAAHLQPHAVLLDAASTPPSTRRRRPAAVGRGLDGERGARRLDRAGELDQQPVAQRLEDAAAALRRSADRRRGAAPATPPARAPRRPRPGR